MSSNGYHWTEGPGPYTYGASEGYYRRITHPRIGHIDVVGHTVEETKRLSEFLHEVLNRNVGTSRINPVWPEPKYPITI